jgi:hypothetical protein
MALRNQVSDAWQAVGIGIAAAVVTAGLAVGASMAAGKISVARNGRASRLAQQQRPPSTRTSSVVSNVDEATEDAMSARGSLRSYRNPLLEGRPSSRLSGDAGGVEVVGRNSAAL